jgi:uncharacterized membrane protein YphA (DoxX/SURF4 family)
MRILIGFLAFANWCLIGVHWDSWFSERGYLPNYTSALWFGDRLPLGFGTGLTVPRLNLLHGVTDPRITIPFYLGVVLCSLLTCLGLGTRFAAFLLAVGTVTLQHRTGPMLHAGDSVLRIGVIYLAISPCGRACSLDRLIGIWRNRESHAPVRIPVWPQRIFQYNTALIYLTTIWLKLHGDKWRWPLMDATWFTERIPEFYRFPVPEFMRSLWVARAATLGTVLVEICLGTIVFLPVARKWVLLAGLLLHAYIEYSMNIPLFSLLMVSLYVSFYDGEEIAAWAQRLGLRLRMWHVRVYLPRDTQLTFRAVAFLDAIDPLKMVSYYPGDGESWTAARFDGRPIAVAKAVGSRSLGAWVFAWCPSAVTRILARSLRPATA